MKPKNEDVNKAVGNVRNNGPELLAEATLQLIKEVRKQAEAIVADGDLSEQARASKRQVGTTTH